ncbi:MAG: DUF885 family protein [Deltaproteobacteria bacterium]
MARELGDGFDLRAFNDAVLAGGALPLDVLDRVMAGWVDAQVAANSGGVAARIPQARPAPGG